MKFSSSFVSLVLIKKKKRERDDYEIKKKVRRSFDKYAEPFLSV